MATAVMTVTFVVRGGFVLLGQHKRGHLVGRWNGFGGRVDANQDDDITSAAIRELFEESRLTVRRDDMCKAASLTIDSVRIGLVRLHVYVTPVVYGQEQETAEMKPQWFPLGELPYADMWSSDVIWLPRVLEGERLCGELVLDGDDIPVRTQIGPTSQAFLMENDRIVRA